MGTPSIKRTSLDHTESAAVFLQAAAELLGDKGFTTDREDLDPWLTDWRGRYTGRAMGLASPSSTKEVADLVKLCACHKIPIVPQGGNSGMVGGATPDTSGTAIILSLRRMNTIRSVDAASGKAICEAGVILQTFQEAVEDVGMRFPLTLGGRGSATIGGLISTNAGGTQVLRHGTMRAQVLGLEAVLADGEIFDGLVSLKKDNRGFDLKQLMIGSEGTLGIITAATLRILTAPTAKATAWVGLPGIVEARSLLQFIERSMGETLEGFEVVPAHCLDGVLAYIPESRSPLNDRHEWNALIECVATQGEDASLRERLEEVLGEAMEKALLEDATIAATEAQAETFWLLRDSISSAERARGPAVQHDISVPVEKMHQFILAVIPAIESEFPGTKGAAFGHLGDGNVHLHIIAPDKAVSGAWENEQGKRVNARVHDLVTEWGGSISAEHGIGQMKVDELSRLGESTSLLLMRKIKKALDPSNLLNPGKLVPLDVE